MNSYIYSLDKKSRKHICPGCCKKRLVRYVDTQTGEYLPDRYGRCDREVSCTYHTNPYTDGYASEITYEEQDFIYMTPPRPVLKFIPLQILVRTWKDFIITNTFVQNLKKQGASANDIEKVLPHYCLGTVSKGYYAGAMTFPFIDIDHNVRAIQAKTFVEDNHTDKTTTLTHIIEKHSGRNIPDWLVEYNTNDKLFSCLFGEHLLPLYPTNPIGLVEAPKTAIYGTLYFGLPDTTDALLWLAVYNLSSLTYERCKVLKGRDVYLYPDLSKDGKAYELWVSKAEKFRWQIPDATFTVSDYLERIATEKDRERGLDLADYLIRKLKTLNPAA